MATPTTDPTESPATVSTALAKRKRPWRLILGALALLIIVLTIAGVVYIRRSFRVYYMPAESMEPTLMGHDKGISPTGVEFQESIHDKFLVDLNAYSKKPMRHGDIIAFRAPLKADLRAELTGRPPAEMDLAKRIIGLPGDTIHFKEDEQGILRVYRNHRSLEEPYIKEPMTSNPMATFGVEGALKLGANELFVMGDNRNNSNDSRFWGPLDGNRVIGKVTAIIAPANRERQFP